MKNFAYNFYMFFRALAINDRIFWANMVSRIKNSKIHPDTKIYKHHSISNSSIGKGSYISQNAMISNTQIGKFCSIGPNLLAGWGIHPIHGISTSPVFYSSHRPAGFTLSKNNKVTEKLPIYIGNDVFIGANVTILDGVTIGDGAVIGAGAVVSKDIPPYAVAVGCPIQIIKYRFERKVIDRLLELKWWDGDEVTLQKVEKMFFEVEKFVSPEDHPLNDTESNE
ncbi:MAG: CatB-related O-acetyltransferase [Cyclobacteriaceae bacterium]